MTQLAKLADLAKDTSIAGRKSLIGTLTDMYLAAGDGRGQRVAFLFGDIAVKILDQLEEETRAALAGRVCHDELAPHQLMLLLAQDTFSVAGPVLSNSPVLATQDLVSIASGASMKHLGAIAGRETVEQSVTSVLVDRGDTTVLSRVAQNQGADFADASFLTLLKRAGSDRRVQAALLTRQDLPDEAGRLLVPMLSPDLQQRINALGGKHPLARLIAKEGSGAKQDDAKKAERIRAQINALVQQISSGKTIPDEAVRRFARAGQPTELAMLLAGLSKLPGQAVSQLLFSANDKPLVILCKANGVSAEAYKDILMMRAQRLQIGGMELNDAIQRYGLMSVEGARRSLDALRQSCRPPQPAAGQPSAAPPQSKDAPTKSIPFAAQR